MRAGETFVGAIQLYHKAMLNYDMTLPAVGLLQGREIVLDCYCNTSL